MPLRALIDCIDPANLGTESLLTMLGKLWRGDYSLRTTFWGFYVLGMIICFFLAGSLAFLFRFFHLHTLGFLLGLLLSFSYWLIASVGVWQSAKVGFASPIWMDRIAAIIARCIILLVVARLLLNLMDGGALRLMAFATGNIDAEF